MKQSRLSGALALSAAQASVLLLGYVTHIWIGRKLGPAQYGIYGVVLSVQTILGMFLTLGVPSAVARFVAQDAKHARAILRQALWLQTFIGVILAGISIVAAPVIAHFLGDSSLTGYIMFSALVIFFQAYYPVFAQFFSGLHQFNRQALITGVYAVAKLAGAISLLVTFRVYGAFAGFAIGGIVAAILGWWWSRRSNQETTDHVLPLRHFLGFATTYVAMLVGLQILMSLDLFMVKAMIGSDIQAGYYNAAVTLSRIPYFLLQGIMFILLPSISALTKPGQSHQEAAVFIRQALRYLIMLIVPAITIAAATSKQLITLFYSKQYLDAAPVLTVLMMGLGALAFYLMLVNIVAGAGKAKVGLAITAAMLIISPVVGVLVIPHIGLLGAAWQTTTAAFVGLIILAIYTFRTFEIPVPVRSIVHVILATAMAVAPTYFISLPTLLLPFLYLVLFLLYGIILWLFQEIKADDWERVASVHPLLRKIIPTRS